MTLIALHVRVNFVPERTRRTASTPRRQRPPIFDTDLLGQRPIEICGVLLAMRLVTGITVLRQRRELSFLVVTGEAVGVCDRPRFERSLLQPERVANVFRRLGYELIV